jgi:hypothetical protein
LEASSLSFVSLVAYVLSIRSVSRCTTASGGYAGLGVLQPIGERLLGRTVHRLHRGRRAGHIATAELCARLMQQFGRIV